MKRTRLTNVIDALCVLLMIASTVYLVMHLGDVPDRIPRHYNWSGQIDGWMDKSLVWIHPVLMVGLFILFSIVEFFPRLHNMGGIKVTDENRERLYPLIRNAASTCKLLVVTLFSVIVVDVVHGGTSSPKIIFCFLVLLTVNVLFWWIRMFRNR